MTWLTWRQFRVPALSVFVGLAAIGVVLAVTGPELVGQTDFSDQDFLYGGTALLMYLLPAVIGVFWGVPMITRELEGGTHSLIWNQTVTRRHWLAAKVAVGVLAAMVAAGLLSLAVTWWASPIDAVANQQTDRGMLNWMSPVVFAARGVAPIGYAAFSFVLGVACGILLRRTVLAMAVTLVALLAVMLAVPFLVRPYFLPALEETVAITGDTVMGIHGDNSGVLEGLIVAEPAGAWVLADETVDSAGNVVSPLPDFVQDCVPRPGENPKGGPGVAPPPGGMQACMAQLGERGYHQRITYQPGYRFWALQWIELAFFLALSALLTWLCFRRLRHLS
ncbi:transporter [Actinophytocola sp.]|uniref:transporter n=1 Tax=Actinophytocola sp. TaxID=1872138 RepID=UPI00389AACCF